MQSATRTIPYKSRRMAAAVLLASLVVYGCGGAEERQAEYYQRAQQLFDEGNYEKARIEVRNVLQINANNADGRYLMALLEEKDRNWRGMFSNLNSALEIDPDHILARVKLAQLYVASGDLENAKVQIDDALQRQPDSADALSVHASILQREQQTEAAEAAARKALTIDPGHVNAIGVLVGIYGESDPEQALEWIEQGLAQQPKDAVLKLLKIRVLSAHNRLDDAEQVFRQLIAENPDSLYYPYQFTNFLIQNQRGDEAEKLLLETIDRHPDEARRKSGWSNSCPRTVRRHRPGKPCNSTPMRRRETMHCNPRWRRCTWVRASGNKPSMSTGG